MYQPRSSPYGEVFTINTGYIDQIANRVYQEQKIREQQKLQQDKALDDEFAKNVAGVKSADIPEITKAYSDFKNAHINLQKKGQKATPQDQMDVMIKKAAAFQAINASKEDKERLKQYLTEVKADKKGVFDPNAHTMVNTWLNTPTSKRNLDEDANLKYKYAMPNIDKEIKNAVTPPVGKEVVEIDLGIDPSDPLKDKKKTYKVINPPNAVYNSLYSGLGSRSDNDNFAKFMQNSLSDEEKNKLRTDFELKISSPEFKQIYGDVQPFPESASKTNLGEAVALKVMQAFVDLPLNGTEKSVLNADRSLAARNKFAQEQQARGFAQQKLMEGIRQAGRKELFGMQQAAKNAGEVVYDTWIDNYIDKTVDEARKSGQEITYKFSDGRVEKGRKIQIDPILGKQLGFDDKNPGQLMITDDGKFIPMFYETDKNYQPISKDGKFSIEPTKTNVLTQDQIKFALGGKAGVKQLNKEMTQPSTNKKEQKAKQIKPKADPLGLGF